MLSKAAAARINSSWLRHASAANAALIAAADEKDEGDTAIRSNSADAKPSDTYKRRSGEDEVEFGRT